MIAEVLARLENVKRMGAGATARCPSHEDRENSLKVDPGDDGRVLLHCHAGCSFEDIIRELRFEARDLMPERESFPLSEASEVYDYDDESGSLLFRVARFVPKTFRQFRPDGTPGIKGVRRVPYRLPKILEAVKAKKHVFIVEGERDVHTLERLGFVATTNPGGAGKWHDDWRIYFDGAFVAIIGDNDDTGKAHVNDVARSLKDDAASVKVVALPVPPKGDVTDWVRSGGGTDDLKSLVRSAPPWSESRDLAAQVMTLADVQSTRVEWLWPGYLPLGKIVTLEGDPGQGKSTITLDIAAKLSTASPMPDMYRPDAPATTLLFTAEDSVADTVKPRLEAVDADLTRIHAVTAINTDDGPRPLAVPEDVDALEQAIRAYDARLVIIDPFIQFLSSSIDAHRDHDVRRAMYPLTSLAERTGVCILLMRHLNKGQGRAMYRGGGSIGITGAVRLGMVVGTEPDTEQRVLAVYKSNLAAMPTPISYSIVPAELRGVGCIRWGMPIDCTADELLAAPNKSKARRVLEEA